MPKVLSSPKLPTGKGGSRRNFRLSPLEIGVAILVAMGGVFLIYMLLSGLFGSGDSPAPANSPLGPDISNARLDQVLSAAEAASRQLKDLERRLVEMDKRLSQAGQKGSAPAANKGGNPPANGANPKLVARVDALEKALANLPAAPAGKGKGADPKLAARLDKLEKGLAALEKKNQGLSDSLGGEQAKLAPRLEQLEKTLDAMEKQNLDLAQELKKRESSPGSAKLAARVAELEKTTEALAQKPAAPAANDKLDQRLAALEKQVRGLGQRPAAGGAPASPELAQRLAGQGQVLAGLSTSLGQLQRNQARLEKQVGALATSAPSLPGAPLASPLLTQRLASLEKQINAQARASRQDQAAAQRVEEMEKELAEVRKQAAAALRADPKLSARLAALEKKMSADSGDSRVTDRRLEALERRVAVLAARPAPAPAARPTTARTAPAASTAAPTASAAPAASADGKPVRIMHVVRPGQTLFGLARAYGVKMSQIREWNPRLEDRDKLYIGEKLLIVIRK